MELEEIRRMTGSRIPQRSPSRPTVLKLMDVTGYVNYGHRSVSCCEPNFRIPSYSCIQIRRWYYMAVSYRQGQRIPSEALYKPNRSKNTTIASAVMSRTSQGPGTSDPTLVFSDNVPSCASIIHPSAHQPPGDYRLSLVQPQPLRLLSMLCLSIPLQS